MISKISSQPVTKTIFGDDDNEDNNDNNVDDDDDIDDDLFPFWERLGHWVLRFFGFWILGNWVFWGLGDFWLDSLQPGFPV